jgi:hypothetical protein
MGVGRPRDKGFTDLDFASTAVLATVPTLVYLHALPTAT